MIASKFTVLLALCCSVLSLQASPRSALSSTDQQTRDVAARICRATFVSPSRTNWDSLVVSLKVGMPKEDVLRLLKPVTVRMEGAGGSGNWEFMRFRLDDVWILDCSFEPGFQGCKLYPDILDVWVEPPSHFSGLWRTYRANGQKGHENYYKDGKSDGESTSFRDDGSKAYVSHFVNGVQEGEDTGYFASGKVSYRGIYKTNAQVGTWTWFKEDGTVESTKDYSRR